MRCAQSTFSGLQRGDVVSRESFFSRLSLVGMSTTSCGRYSAHGFRRGAAFELQSTGSQWSTVATIGDWRSLAFKGYVDLTNELSRDLSRLLADDVVLGEEDEKDD